MWRSCSERARGVRGQEHDHLIRWRTKPGQRDMRCSVGGTCLSIGVMEGDACRMRGNRPTGSSLRAVSIREDNACSASARELRLGFGGCLSSVASALVTLACRPWHSPYLPSSPYLGSAGGTVPCSIPTPVVVSGF